MKISSILATKGHEIITIGPEQTLQYVVELLVRHNIGALPVLDENGKLIGIISERDVIRYIAKGGTLVDTAVREIMTRKVIVGVPQDDIISVANTMTEKRFRHLPIVEGDNLIGIISIGDILKAQRDTYRGEIDTLETQIMAGDDV
ncbi:MAG: CBS domain-containing protein [Phycisphaerae bacterium]|nr:CBS domain-containing protein [Phycisphaerae bacterium]NIX32017.1 CBS domain-containing protein [Phycisphaerae bacterium]